MKLEYEAQGGGEPMLLIHGASVVEVAHDADTLFGTVFPELEKGLFSAADAPRGKPPRSRSSARGAIRPSARATPCF